MKETRRSTNLETDDRCKSPAQVAAPADSLPGPLHQISLQKNVHARRLFDGIAHDYDWPADLFSLFQYHHWHQRLVASLHLRSELRVLDVCTGPGGVAIAIAQNAGCHVVGLDISQQMIDQAQVNLERADLASQISLVRARAEDLQFRDQCFDVVVFTFLLRYVDDPGSVLCELSRVLKIGGQMASLEFHIPPGRILYPLWLLHTRLLLAWGSRLFSPEWREVGVFLGPSISNFFAKHSVEDLSRMWARAGILDVQTELLSRGGVFIMHGRKG